MSAEELANTDIEKLREITANAVFNDDELAMEGVEFKCDDMSRGVDKILYKCPKCLKEGNITAGTSQKTHSTPATSNSCNWVTAVSHWPAPERRGHQFLFMESLRIAICH